MSKDNQQNLKIPSKAICLKLSIDEYNRLDEISKERGENIQTLIRKSVLGDSNLRPLMASGDAKNHLSEIKRIGNNFNQIARKLNSGFRRDWYDSFEKCADNLDKLTQVFSKNVAS